MTGEKKVGIFFIAAVLIMIVLLESVENKSLFRKEYTLMTYFSSIRGLEQGDPVRLAGLKIGEIKDIQVLGDRIEVLMSLYKDTVVKSDSQAAIKMNSLLGGRYVDLSLGSSSNPPLKPGAVVDSIDTPDLDELLAKVNSVLSNIETFTGLLGDSGPHLEETLASLNRLTAKAEKGEGTLGKLLTDDSLYEEAKKTVREVGKAAEGIQDQTPIATFTSVLFGISR